MTGGVAPASVFLLLKFCLFFSFLHRLESQPSEVRTEGIQNVRLLLPLPLQKRWIRKDLRKSRNFTMNFLYILVFIVEFHTLRVSPSPAASRMVFGEFLLRTEEVRLPWPPSAAPQSRPDEKTPPASPRRKKSPQGSLPRTFKKIKDIYAMHIWRSAAVRDILEIC